MVGIIIAQNGASKDLLDLTVESAQRTGLAEIAVIADNESGIAGAINRAGRPLHEAFHEALSSMKAERIVLLDATLGADAIELQSAIGSLSQIKDADLAYAPLRNGSNRIELPSLSPSTIVSFIASNPEWPMLLTFVGRESLAKYGPITGESMVEIAAQLAVKIAASNGTIATAITPLRLHSSAHSLRMSDGGLSRLLLSVIGAANIEDLFPSDRWEGDEQESAALAYQSLAALFIKWGDTSSAEDCLRLSDRLDDSPRALALKGLIAKNRGEMLGAVANMVASLQQYESRHAEEKPSSTLIIERESLDKVSDRLEAGLTALNAADNAAALEHFSAAVFSVDPFYKDSGLC